jgi:hypothetical protein
MNFLPVGSGAFICIAKTSFPSSHKGQNARRCFSEKAVCEKMNFQNISARFPATLMKWQRPTKGRTTAENWQRQSERVLILCAILVSARVKMK